MLTIEEALGLCLEVELPRRTEVVPLGRSYGRLLAEHVCAPHPVPHWDNSAMDGFAVRAADTRAADTRAADTSAADHKAAPGLPCSCDDELAQGEGGVVLDVLETVGAGSVATTPVVPGTCVRIMTGAPLPSGADAVVMREHTTEAGPGRVRVGIVARSGQHVRRQGEELAEGQVVLARGQVLTPAAVGACASMGRVSVEVAVRPRVAILSTGDEVVPPGQPLQPGQIWSSNSAALVGLVLEAGGEPVDCGNAPDDLEGTREALRAALACGPDLLVTSGGVSVGDFDVVKRALGDEGAQMRFWKVRMKPGKPLAFGVIGGVPAFGLPGNPVSTMVNFLQFVRPVIRRALGDSHPFLPVVDARLSGDVRRKPGRNELVRVSLAFDGAGLVATAAGAQGSGMTTSMVRAHGLLLLDGPSIGARDGDRVAVQLIDPGFLCAAEPGYRWGGR